MKSKSSKTLKPVATKKEKTGPTKEGKSSTSSKPRTSPTSCYIQVFLSNLKDTFHTVTDASWNLSGKVTRKSICEYSLHETTQSGKEVSRSIRIGPSGLEYLGPLDVKYRKIGWGELEDVALDCDEWAY